jgi:hypothetical protein
LSDPPEVEFALHLAITNLPTYQPTPWASVLIEKLIDPQLTKKLTTWSGVLLEKVKGP